MSGLARANVFRRNLSLLGSRPARSGKKRSVPLKQARGVRESNWAVPVPGTVFRCLVPASACVCRGPPRNHNPCRRCFSRRRTGSRRRRRNSQLSTMRSLTARSWIRRKRGQEPSRLPYSDQVGPAMSWKPATKFLDALTFLHDFKSDLFSRNGTLDLGEQWIVVCYSVIPVLELYDDSDETLLFME